MTLIQFTANKHTVFFHIGQRYIFFVTMTLQKSLVVLPCFLFIYYSSTMLTADFWVVLYFAVLFYIHYQLPVLKVRLKYALSSHIVKQSATCILINM